MTKNTTRRLVAELQALFAQPNEAETLELIIRAELRASAAIRRVCGDAASPLISANVQEQLASLKAATGERGAAWNDRVDTLLRKATDQGADPASVALVRLLAQVPAPNAIN